MAGIDLKSLCIIGCWLVFGSNQNISAQPPAPLQKLQQSVRQIVEKSQPAIATVLVSRSKAYTRYDQGPSTAEPGKLGGFQLPADFATKLEIEKRSLIKLDLSHPLNIPENYGGGILLDDSGLVLTTYHVIEGATRLYVQFSETIGGSYADIYAADKRADLAVLKLLHPPKNLQSIKLSSATEFSKGDLIISLCSPVRPNFRQLGPDVTWGIISNLRKRTSGPVDEIKRNKPLAQYDTLIQTDFRTNTTCSGGAIFDLNGKLIAISTAQPGEPVDFQPSYAIPLNRNTKRIVDVLLQGKEVEYGFLGVSINVEDRRQQLRNGILVSDCLPNTPAYRAGIRGGEWITTIDREPIRDHDDLFLNIGAALAGNVVTIETSTIRGTKRTVEVRLTKAGHREPFIAQNRPHPVFGMLIDYASILNINSNLPEGVVLKEVVPDSPAAKKFQGLMEQQQVVIIEVNGKSIKQPSDFYQACREQEKLEITIISATNNWAATRQTISLP
ncbi:MAG: trypsin-like peptidase domain-containing protein [Zavarzinella sp.]